MFLVYLNNVQCILKNYDVLKMFIMFNEIFRCAIEDVCHVLTNCSACLKKMFTVYWHNVRLLYIIAYRLLEEKEI